MRKELIEERLTKKGQNLWIVPKKKANGEGIFY